MKFNRLYSLGFIATISASAILYTGCSSSQSEEQTSSLKDENSSAILKVNNKIFSIPSPIQTALLIKDCGAKYQKELLNNPANYERYTSSFSKALNLGIYGADLGYATIYDQKQDAFGYMKSAKLLTEDLGISDAFGPTMIERLNKNFNDKDSLLAMISDAYANTNSYLNGSEQNDISGLVLLGGWIESLYITSEIYRLTQKEEVKQRIGEQKTSLRRIHELMKSYGDNPEYKSIIDDLEKLSAIYDQVEFVNTLVQATTDSKKKLTTVNCKTEIKITDKQINEISISIKEIRKKIIA
jgi:hypothetical protein